MCLDACTQLPTACSCTNRSRLQFLCLLSAEGACNTAAIVAHDLTTVAATVQTCLVPRINSLIAADALHMAAEVSQLESEHCKSVVLARCCWVNCCAILTCGTVKVKSSQLCSTESHVAVLYRAIYVVREHEFTGSCPCSYTSTGKQQG